MENNKHTQGKVHVNETVQNDENLCSAPFYELGIDGGYFWLARVREGENGEGLVNSNLIAEAFNVANESGYTPRQLLDRVKQLEFILEKCPYFLYNIGAGQADELADDIISELSHNK